jgi:hypothetical protein
MTANEPFKKLSFKQILVPSVSPMNTLLTSFKAREFFSSILESAVSAVGVFPLIFAGLAVVFYIALKLS